MECEGEVEVYFRQDWRRVLLDSWSESEASVVCRQLGCGSVFSFSSSSTSSPEHRHVCVTGFSCSGSEAHLGNCRTAQAVNCSSREQLSVSCSGKFDPAHSSIRLVGSGGDCAGRLEVFHSGSWGTVSDDLWDIKDAQVVCRQLQCGVALSAPVPVQFGPGTGPIWLYEVECEGNETSLLNCRFQLCGEDECGHKDDVGVMCSEFKEFRLTEGCEGNLEVFYNGTWGNVCENGMTDETVSLICQELNCARSGNEKPTNARVESAPNWLDNLKCRKHDSTLWQCPSSPWRQNYCDNRNEVAHITCSDISVPSTAAPIITTTTSITTVGQTVKGTNTPPQTPPEAVPSIYPVSLLVLGAVLFLALVLLVVLFYQNRALRRGLSKRRRKTLTEAVYEEIDRRNIPKRNDLTQRGSVLSEEQHSGYEDVDEELLSAKSLTGIKAEYYDDVTTSGLTSESANENTVEDYDDVITAGQISDSVAEDVAENYDDVITADQSSAVETDDMTDNYDDAVTAGPNSNIMTVNTPENYDDVITAEQDIGGVKDYDDVEEAPQTEMNHVTERPQPVSFLRKLHSNLFKLKK
ncbi:hypothetical protein SRHO_G00002530 [Serrasalmus rhombeus]